MSTEFDADTMRSLKFDYEWAYDEIVDLRACRDRLTTALRQIFTGAAEPHDGLTYSEIADIADKALRGGSE